MKKKFQLFPSTKITKGYHSTCIHNMQNEFIYSVQNNLLEEYFDDYEFLEFLESKNLGVFTEVEIEFVTNEQNFELPYHIHSVIFEGINSIQKSFEYLVNKNVIINNICIIVGNTQEIDEIILLLTLFSKLGVESITFAGKSLESIKKKLVGLNELFYVDFVNNESLNQNLVFVNNSLFYNETLEFNTRYNSKILIDDKGNIFSDCDGNVLVDNILSPKLNTKESFLNEVRSNKLWKASKEKCDVCSDCEYRNVCYDSRKLMPRGNFWYSLTECTYNPYISKIKGQEGYYSLEACGVLSDVNGFIIDHQKIKDINNKNFPVQ